MVRSILLSLFTSLDYFFLFLSATAHIGHSNTGYYDYSFGMHTFTTFSSFVSLAFAPFCITTLLRRLNISTISGSESLFSPRPTVGQHVILGGNALFQFQTLMRNVYIEKSISTDNSTKFPPCCPNLSRPQHPNCLDLVIFLP